MTYSIGALILNTLHIATVFTFWNASDTMAIAWIILGALVLTPTGWYLDDHLGWQPEGVF